MVNTFLPFPDFATSIKCLDDKRCNKQRVEAYQLLQALFLGTKWQNHPACIMWRGYENALIYYYNLCLLEWINRGRNSEMKYLSYTGDIVMPWWVGWYHFHESHKASLLRKFPDYYCRHFTVSEYHWNRGYVWPSKLAMPTSICVGDTPSKAELLKIPQGMPSKVSTSNDPTMDVSIWKTITDPVLLESIFAEIQWEGIRPREETRKQLYTLPMLREEAKRRGFTGVSSMNKDTLLELLQLQ